MTSVRPHRTVDQAPPPKLDDRRLRWVTALGLPGVLAVAFALTVGTAAMVEAVSSPLGLLTLLVALAAWVAIAWFVLPRLAHRTVPRLGLVLAVGLVAAVVTILPYYRGSTVHEASPGVADVGGGTGTGSSSAGPSVTARGEVFGIGHNGSGSALLLRLQDGREVLRFEGLDVDNAPDMQVYLVPGRDKQAPNGSPHLGGLKANRGDQNYPIKAGQLQPGPVTALIYCRAFSVPIAAASLG